MSALAISMALLWLLAECAILVLVRWGARCAVDVVTGREPPPLLMDRFARTIAGVFAVVALALAFSDTIVREAVAGHARAAWYAALIEHLAWNALSAAWVGLEGAIALYVLRIDRLLQARLAGGPLPRPGAGHLWLLMLWPAFAVVYNALAAASAFRQDFDEVELARVLQFFLRFCGVGWILFELVVARSGVRMARLLAGRRA